MHGVRRSCDRAARSRRLRHYNGFEGPREISLSLEQGGEDREQGIKVHTWSHVQKVGVVTLFYQTAAVRTSCPSGTFRP